MSKLIRKGVEYYLPAKDLLDYNPEDGNLRWRVPLGNFSRVGTVAGGMTNRGYIHVRVSGTKLLAHRIAWFLTHGTLPDHIDHINGVKTDNRMANLRACTASENAMNRQRPSVLNTSGHTGVLWNQRLSKWTASIQFEKESSHLGVFSSKEDAIEAREKAFEVLSSRMHPHTFGTPESQPTSAYRPSGTVDS